MEKQITRCQEAAVGEVRSMGCALRLQAWRALRPSVLTLQSPGEGTTLT